MRLSLSERTVHVFAGEVRRHTRVEQRIEGEMDLLSAFGWTSNFRVAAACFRTSNGR